MAKDEIASRGEAANPAKTADKKLEKAGPERFDQSADLNAAASAVAGMGAATGFEQDEGGLSSPAPKQGADGAGSSVPATDALPEYDVTAAAASPVEATRSETNPQDPQLLTKPRFQRGHLLICQTLRLVLQTRYQNLFQWLMLPQLRLCREKPGP